LIEVEAVEGCGGSFGELGDALTKSVVFGQLVALLGEGLALAVDAAASGVEFLGSALHLDELDQSGLVEVDEPVAFGQGGVGPAVEAGQLGGEQFVVGCRGAGGDCVFAGEEHVGAKQRVADLLEDEGVEVIGADVPFRAAAVLAAGAQRVVVAAVVVAVTGAVAAAHLVAVDPDAAAAAADEAAQQPGTGLGVAWTPFRVVAGDPAGGLRRCRR
jgi:hypothetical protein